MLIVMIFLLRYVLFSSIYTLWTTWIRFLVRLKRRVRYNSVKMDRIGCVCMFSQTTGGVVAQNYTWGGVSAHGSNHRGYTLPYLLWRTMPLIGGLFPFLYYFEGEVVSICHLLDIWLKGEEFLMFQLSCHFSLNTQQGNVSSVELDENRRKWQTNHN